MDKFRQAAVVANLQRVVDDLDNKKWFDICPADGLARCLGIALPKKLNPMHCIYYKDMPPGFKAEIAEELDLHFGDALRKCGIQFFTSPPDGKVARYTLEKL